MDQIIAQLCSPLPLPEPVTNTTVDDTPTASKRKRCTSSGSRPARSGKPLKRPAVDKRCRPESKASELFAAMLASGGRRMYTGRRTPRKAKDGSADPLPIQDVADPPPIQDASSANPLPIQDATDTLPLQDVSPSLALVDSGPPGGDPPDELAALPARPKGTGKQPPITIFEKLEVLQYAAALKSVGKFREVRHTCFVFQVCFDTTGTMCVWFS